MKYSMQSVNENYELITNNTNEKMLKIYFLLLPR